MLFISAEREQLCHSGAHCGHPQADTSKVSFPVQSLPVDLSVLGVSLQPCGVSGGPSRGDCGARPGQCLSDLTSKTFLLESQEWMLG